MLTTTLLVLAALLVMVLIGFTFAWMTDPDSGFFGWWCGWQTMQSLFEVLALIVAALFDSNGQ